VRPLPDRQEFAQFKQVIDLPPESIIDSSRAGLDLVALPG
jgi:hypothetical protein